MNTLQIVLFYTFSIYHKPKCGFCPDINWDLC